MPLFPSDFKKFKHVSSDSKSTTLRHEKGHELKIAHAALSPKMRQQLSALSKAQPKEMAEGGYAEAKRAGALGSGPKVQQEQQDKSAPKEDITKRENVPSSSSQHQKSAQEKFDEHMKSQPATKEPGEDNMAQGGEVCYACGGPARKMYAMPQGTEVSAHDNAPTVPEVDDDTTRTRQIYNSLIQPPPSNFSSAKGEAPPDENMMFTPNKPPTDLNPQVWAQARQKEGQEKAQNAAQTAQAQQDVISKNQALTDAGLPPMPVPNVPTGQQPPGSEESLAPDVTAGAQQEVAANQPKTSQAQQEWQNPAQMAGTGYEQGLQGISAKATAEGNLAQEQLKALQTQQNAQVAAKAKYQEQYDALESERQNLIHDINEGHIDPEKYWTGDKDGNGSHSRILSGIGMILAGFNPTNSPNAAINYLKYQMDQNLDAQKQNLNSKNNLLAMNLRQFGNLRDATEFTRMQQNDMLQNQLQQAAATATSPLAKAAAIQAKGQFKLENVPRAQQFAMMQTMMHLANNPDENPDAAAQMISYARIANPELAKSMESRYVHGVGMSPTTPVPEEARKQIIATKNVNDLMNMSLEFSKKHAGSLDPATLAQAKTIQQQLIGTIKQAQHDGVYKPSEAEFLTDQIGGSPASFLANISSVPKIKELQAIKQNEYRNLLSTYNLPTKPLPEPESSQVVTGKDGKQYKKVIINGKSGYVPVR